MSLLPQGWHLWVLGAIAAGALEIKLGNFFFAWLGVGAIAAAVASAIGLPLEVQLLGFTVLSVALFAASRTVFKHLLMRRADRHPSGVDTLLGEEATVTEAIGERSGAVRLHGELWAARSLEGPIAEGERVRVEQVEGLKLHVRRQRAAIWDRVPKEN